MLITTLQAIFSLLFSSVYVDGVVVGAVCCRIEPPESPKGQDALYIMTLGVLAAWRRRAIGTQLLRRVLGCLPRYPSVGQLYLHVQTNNEEAIGFYKVGCFTLVGSRASFC